MCDRGLRIGIIGLTVLALTSQASRGQNRFETQLKTVTVVDANGAPVPDARVYTGECLAWNNRAQTVRLTEQLPWQRTDANGVFSFEFIRQGAGRPYFVTDASFERMGCLHIARKDPAETYTVQLEKLARIKGVIRSADVAFSRVHVSVPYRRERDLFPLLSSDCHLDAPVHEMMLDLLCPAGCDLYLHIESDEPAFERYQKRQEIAALKPGQVVDLGSIELRRTSGCGVFGKPAPELQVAEWVKGKPATLAELKGKVVLLEFWGLWCAPCRRALPQLAELHTKYAKDGLVIIAVHDSSQTGASLLDKSRDLLDLSQIPFRIAVDSPREGSMISDETRGTGRTIDAYDITAFPTGLIISKDGQIDDQPMTEERLYHLLYGRPMPQSTALSRFLTANRRLCITVGIATALILILGLVLVALWLRRSKIIVREP
jgi:thiol-disulfide isomerase/thioredoxin